VPALYFKSASGLLRRRRCSTLPLTPPPRRSDDRAAGQVNN